GHIVVALSPGPQPLPVPARHGNALRFSADSPMRGQQTVVCGKCPQNPTELAGQSPSGGFDGILSVACAPSRIRSGRNDPGSLFGSSHLFLPLVVSNIDALHRDNDNQLLSFFAGCFREPRTLSKLND